MIVVSSASYRALSLLLIIIYIIQHTHTHIHTHIDPPCTLWPTALCADGAFEACLKGSQHTHIYIYIYIKMRVGNKNQGYEVSMPAGTHKRAHVSRLCVCVCVGGWVSGYASEWVDCVIALSFSLLLII